ncbi:hypothetical protein J6590_040076 [Homalodisca vitripennis]|nr:hypothetical protein J6590_040076 [Homalodisca vitripennis]
METIEFSMEMSGKDDETDVMLLFALRSVSLMHRAKVRAMEGEETPRKVESLRQGAHDDPRGSSTLLYGTFEMFEYDFLQPGHHTLGPRHDKVVEVVG